MARRSCAQSSAPSPRTRSAACGARSPNVTAAIEVHGNPAMPRCGSKIVLVTGASSGLGAALARELAARGHSLALIARRAGRLRWLASPLSAQGTEVLELPADLADPETPARIIAETVEHFGGLDVLVNNAGFGLPRYFGESTPDELRRQIEVNLLAPLMLARHALPALIESRGTIINIGSAITAVPN